MKYNVVQMSAWDFFRDMYSGGPIFDDFIAYIWLNLLLSVY